MIIKDVNLETVCGITGKLPANTQPEFAFAGKSNVGKSSLINALMNRRSMREHPRSRARPRRSILPYQRRAFTTSICQGTATRARASRSRQSGAR